MIKVSVIIPVYNGEKHLRQCLDSVCNQTLRDIEIICVDDGSSDSSIDILKEYQAQDSRVQIYQQQNKYAGAARNLGKSHAIGEYLVFWDCDDYFELEALEELYNRAKAMQADICVCGANDYFQDTERLAQAVPHYMAKKKTPEAEVFNRKTNEKYILNFTNAAAWNKIFRRAYIEELGLDFKEIRNGNDAYFTVSALCLAERITTLDKALVTYRTNQKEGLVSSLEKSPLTPIQTWMDAANDLKAKGAFPERSFVNKSLGSMIYLLRNIPKSDAFFEAVRFLQKEGLAAMEICVREEGYYDKPWYDDLVECLCNGTPEDVQTCLAYNSYMQLRKSSADKRIVKEKNKKLTMKVKKLRAENESLRSEIEALRKELEEQNKNKSLVSRLLGK